MKQNTKSFLYPIIIIIILVFGFSFLFKKQNPPKEVTISEIATQVGAGQIDEISVKDNLVTAKVKSGDEEKATKESGVSLKDYGITPDKVKINVVDTAGTAAIYSILSIILPILLIGGFIYFMMRSAQGANSKAMSFGKSNAKLFMGNTKVTFKDVAGLAEPKQELVEVVDFLKNPKKYRDLGAEIPRGILLVGPPGTGKTLMARAVAGEAEVPFFSISASEFVEMFVGVGASRVRDLFTKAKRNAPAIIFVDELDAVGRQRGAGLGGSHDEREQTLNQILVEMDGFESNDNVIVLAATNRPDVLDPALLRPGRFDRQVVIDLPDKLERVDILKVHTRNKPIEGVDLEKVASTTSGFSGADLRNLTNEAAILAARHNKKEINQKDVDNAIEKVMMGPERKSKVMSDKEKKITAFHEAGHAVVSHLLPNADPVHKISIVSRGMALGFTWNLPAEDRRLETKARFEDQIASLLGGRVAEEEFFGPDNITTGAQSDLKRATLIARKMVTEYGMSDKLGPQTYGHRDDMPFLGREHAAEHRNYSEKIANLIDEEVSRLISEGQKKAKDIIDAHKDKMEQIADSLLKHETIDADQFLEHFDKEKEKVAE